ncbi:general transcription factor II-I repeat domain-containing protein 2-like [Lycorma delicatula]|uniref:general transcription factor II-I repeat domain-containing protein 2-like n=1 Tax=Lycorma delicatula TaxID=130591 RepID=UPI003F511BCB
MVNDKCCCLICLTSVAIAKKGNLERHFLALHKYKTDYPPNSELRKHKVRDLETHLTNQQSIFKKPRLKSQAVTTTSFKCDESTDISDTAQLLVFVRMVFKDFTYKEELLGMISLKERTRGVDIFKAFKNLLNDLKVPLFKLVSITTDGAAAMIGCRIGFIALCQNEDEFPAFLSYHCIIHQQVLASKRLNTKEMALLFPKLTISVARYKKEF